MSANDEIVFDDLAYDDLPEGTPDMSNVRESRKPSVPVRSEFELQELGEQLVEAKETKRGVVLRVWKRREPVQGRIVKLDGMTQMVHVKKYGQVIKVPFADILEVKSSE